MAISSDATPTSNAPASSSAGTESGSFVAPTVEELGQALPQFEISEVLGQGGMGAVYKARQPRLNRYVAIKLLPAFTGPDEFNFTERFEREAQAMAQMSHSNIVTVHDFGETEADGLRYIVMEYVDGPDLYELIHGGQLTIQHTMGWIPQICAALQYAHERGVVHRDIKPANILINQDGEAKVVDFGLATLVGPQHDSGAPEDEIAMGTPEYAPPEATEEGAAIDHRADIYSLGILFYEMLTGQVPSGPWKPPSEFGGDIDVRLDAIILKAMQPNPGDRYQNVSEISQALIELRNAPKLVVTATGGKKLQTAAPQVKSRAAAPHKRPARRPQPKKDSGMSGLAFVWIVILVAVAALGFMWANGKLPFFAGEKKPPLAESPKPERAKPSNPPAPVSPPRIRPEREPPKVVSVPEPRPARPSQPDRPAELEIVSPPPQRAETPKTPPEVPPSNPAAPAIAVGGEWVDLIPLLDIDAAQFGGSWSLENGVVKSAQRVTNQDQPRLELPVSLGDTYELEFVFQRASGDGNVVVMLPVDGEHYAPLYLSGFNGRMLGIHALGREMAGSPNNPTGVRMSLDNGRDYRVGIQVSREGESVRTVLHLDGEELFDWSGSADQFPVRDGFGWIPRDKHRIVLGTVSPTTFSVIRVRTAP